MKKTTSLLFAASLGFFCCGRLPAQELKEMRIGEVPEIEQQPVIVLDSREAILIVNSTIPDLSFEANMGVMQVDVPSLGLYHVHLHPGSNIVTFKAPGYRSLQERIYIAPKESKQMEIATMISPAPEGVGEIKTAIDITPAKADSLPQLKQASFVESYSPMEWMIRAAGIGSGKKKRREMNALNDARKCAVYFCLYMGTDPLLTTTEEKNRFAVLEQDFFGIRNVMKYIAWEAQEYSLRVKTPDGKQLKIEKTFRVNVGLLKEDLASRGVLLATSELAAELGLPQIVVVPEVPQGDNPLEAMEKQPELKHAARAIESYLTVRRYDVIALEQQDFLNNYGATLLLIQGAGEDWPNKIALAVGSDVYITFAVNIDRRNVGSTENRKASASVRAFETTTGRLLGTETGYSAERPAPDEVVAEEAIHGAVDKVLSRINAYWKEDLQRGIQYKVIFSMAGNFDRAQIEIIQDAVARVMNSVALRSKENVAGDKMMEYLLWTKPEKYPQARDLFGDIREQFAREARGAAVEKRQLNRKMLLLQIVNH